MTITRTATLRSVAFPAVLAMSLLGVVACSRSGAPASDTSRADPADVSRSALQPSSGPPGPPGSRMCKLSTASWKQVSDSQVRVRIALSAGSTVKVTIFDDARDANFGSASADVAKGAHSITVRVTGQVPDAADVSLSVRGAVTLNCLLYLAPN